MNRSPFLAVLLATPVLAGCVVGPDYHRPIVAPNAAQGTTFRRAGALPASTPQSGWWQGMGDAELDHLVDLALASNPDVDIARARVVQARAGLVTARSNRLPTTGTSAAYVRINGLGGLLDEEGGDAPLKIYSASFDASWEADLFGGKARAVQAARAKSEAEDAAREGAIVSLETEVARAYVQLRQLQARQALSLRNADVQTQMLDKTRQRLNGGTASQLDVELLNNQLQSTLADLAPLAAQIDEQFDRLAILTGQEPGALDIELAAAAPIPAPPANVAVGDPASLLRRRPDIRQAERQLAQSNAVVGERVADQFPKVSLIGLLGFSAAEPGRIFDNTPAQIITPMLQWTPFDFGRNRARIAEARGAYDEAQAQYRKIVLAALQDAETALSRYGRQRDALASLLTVQASADRAAALQAQRAAGGTASTLELLDTERQRISAQLAVSDAQGAVTRDYIALQKSLGLGWQNASSRVD